MKKFDLSQAYGFFGAFIGQFAPICVMFLIYLPPFLKNWRWIVIGAIALFLLFLFWRKRERSRKWVFNVFVGAGIILGVYLGFYNATTYFFKCENVKVQIGFGDWWPGLTDETKEKIKEVYGYNKEEITNDELMRLPGPRPENEKYVWKESNIQFAGWLLVILYCGSLLMWSAAWYFMVNRLGLTEPEISS